MTNLEYLEKMKKEDEGELRKHCTLEEYHLKFRKMKALEIIAEEIINLNSTLRSTVTTLENIDTTLNRR